MENKTEARSRFKKGDRVFVEGEVYSEREVDGWVGVAFSAPHEASHATGGPVRVETITLRPQPRPRAATATQRTPSELVAYVRGRIASGVIDGLDIAAAEVLLDVIETEARKLEAIRREIDGPFGVSMGSRLASRIREILDNRPLDVDSHG